MLKHSMWLAAGFSIAVAAACSGSSSSGTVKGAAGNSSEGGAGGEASVSVSINDYCTQACASERNCDKSLDIKTCFADCKDQFAVSGPNLRGDFITSITTCIQTQDCLTLLDHSALHECANEAVAQLTPSKEGTSFCNDLGMTAEQCNGEFNKADCLNRAKTFTDEAIQAAEECLGKSCTKIGPCIDAILGQVGDDTGAGGMTGAGGQPGAGGSGGIIGIGGTTTGGHTGIGNGSAGEAGAGGAPDLTPYTGACTSNSPSKCVSGTELNLCSSSNKYEVVTCKDFLTSAGFTGSECKDGACQIGTVLDTTCQQGVANLCACDTCTNDDTISYYITCYQDDPAGNRAAIQCMAKAANCDEVTACASPPPM